MKLVLALVDVACDIAIHYRYHYYYLLKFRRLTSTALSSASNFWGSKTLTHFLAKSIIIVTTYY